jgi:cobalamin 5'-phosphate synthase/cobalamin synthase
LNRSVAEEDPRSIAVSVPSLDQHAIEVADQQQRDSVKPLSNLMGGMANQHTPWWGPIAGSIGFLTVIPVPHLAMSSALITRSLALFPLIGALIGALLGGIGLWLDSILPAGPIAALLIAGGALITGGFHLDGLMDTADGLFGARSREQRLTIMRDSRVGAFGVIAGVIAILGQFACLSEITGHARLLALVVAATMSRWTMLMALTIFPAARTSGAGATFHAAATRAAGIAGTLFAVLVALVSGQFGVIALAFSAVAVLGCGQLLTRRLGGLTGDCYGAIAVVTETVVLFIAVARAIP